MATGGKFNYGRSIDFRWRPQADNRDVVAYSLVSARLYGPNTEPTQGQRENAEAGEIEEVLAWVETDDGEYSITFDGVVDDAPESTKRYDRFFVVVTFLYEAGGDEVYDEECIFLWRPDGLTSWPRVTCEDIFGLEFRLQECGKSRKWIEDQIKLAQEDIFARLKAEGFDKHRLFDLEDFIPCAKRRAAGYCCRSLYSEGNPHWKDKADDWFEASDTMFKSVAVGYDLDDDDKPEPDERRATGAVTILR